MRRLDHFIVKHKLLSDYQVDLNGCDGTGRRDFLQWIIMNTVGVFLD